MRPTPFNTCLACLFFLISSSALPRSKAFSKISSSDILHSDADKGQPSWLVASKEEPSCEELKLMWRFSKRQSRAAEITNEIPTYRDPFAYNVWDEYPRARSAGRGSVRYRPVFGKIIHNVPRPFSAITSDNSPDRVRAFEDVSRGYMQSSVYPVARVPPQRKTSFRLGGGSSSSFSHPHLRMQEPLGTSFQSLKDLIISERARELQQQRLNEEAAARAEALKDMVGNIQFGRIVKDQKVHLGQYGPPSGSDAPLNAARSRGIVAFPDLFAPPSQYTEENLVMQPSQIATYKSRSYDGDSVNEEDNPWATW